MYLLCMIQPILLECLENAKRYVHIEPYTQMFYVALLRQFQIPINMSILDEKLNLYVAT